MREVMKMKYKNKKHEARYNEIIAKMRRDDVYHRSAAYLIALNEDCYRHISDIFSLVNDRINIEGLAKPWQTSGSLRATRLMFNLWNEFCYDDSEADEPAVSYSYTVSDIFNNEDAAYFFEAVKLRYPENF
jgi:hypothetical protein